jgi:hypothetical protein
MPKANIWGRRGLFQQKLEANLANQTAETNIAQQEANTNQQEANQVGQYQQGLIDNYRFNADTNRLGVAGEAADPDALLRSGGGLRGMSRATSGGEILDNDGEFLGNSRCRGQNCVTSCRDYLRIDMSRRAIHAQPVHA